MEFKIQNDVQNLKCFPNLSFFRNGWYNHEIKAITTVVPKAHGFLVRHSHVFLTLLSEFKAMFLSVKINVQNWQMLVCGKKIKELILIKKIDVLLCSVKVDLCSSE